MPMERAEKHVYRLTKLFEKHEKLYRLITKKLNDVELDYEELSTKVDEAN